MSDNLDLENAVDEVVVRVLDSRQTSDDFDLPGLTSRVEQLIAEYTEQHCRPGCSCDDCSDDSCPENQ
jgi:hypothetical protein